MVYRRILFDAYGVNVISIFFRIKIFSEFLQTVCINLKTVALIWNIVCRNQILLLYFKNSFA